jgi:hypothetical protein
LEESISTSPKPKKLYRYFSLDPCNKEFIKRILDILSKHRLYAPSPRELNDPFDCIVKLESPDQSVEEEIQRRVNEGGVLSFSENNDNILMWAHYANKHYGVCLEFEMNRWEEIPVDPYLQKIDYKMERPLISQSDISCATGSSLSGSSFPSPSAPPEPYLLKKMAFVKHNDCEYEKEWRIICPFKDPSDRYLIFPKEVLTGIIFGLKTSPADRQRIRAAVESSNSNLNFYEAIENKTRFEVEIIPLSGGFSPCVQSPSRGFLAFIRSLISIRFRFPLFSCRK